MTKKFSGKQIIKAGEKLINLDTYSDRAEFDNAFDALAYWRYSHEKSLENALDLLQKVASKKDKSAIYAKRLKRYISIIVKLRRFPDMKLKNMQDIGGCRAIVSNVKKINQIVRELKRHKEFRNGNGKLRYKDYLKTPKEDGYRGYHLVGQFDNGDNEKRNIELQIRTRLQHDWATTVEIVDLFTGQALKSNAGEESWKNFFLNVSEQFALMEEIHQFNTFDDVKKQESYETKLTNSQNKLASWQTAKEFAYRLDVVKKLDAFANSLKITDQRLSEEQFNGYVLLEINTEEATVLSKLFTEEQSKEAEQSYSSLERNATNRPEIVIALVSTTAVGGIKQAYPNYFADSTEFLTHLLFIIDARPIYQGALG